MVPPELEKIHQLDLKRFSLKSADVQTSCSMDTLNNESNSLLCVKNVSFQL